MSDDTRTSERPHAAAEDANTASVPADAPVDAFAAQYPEHAKQAKIVHKSQAIGEFLEWLNHEQGYVIAERIEEGSTRDATGAWDRSHYLPLHRPISSWLAQYFEIDPVKIEREKRAMLDGMRALHDDEVER